MTDEPAVLTWRIALAPRPRAEPRGRHWWREYVTSTWRAAHDSWAALRSSGLDLGSSVAGGAGSNMAAYQLSDEEFAAIFPQPRLADFMVALSTGALAPESVP